MNTITLWRADFKHSELFNYLLRYLGIKEKYWKHVHIIKFNLDKNHIIELYNEDVEAIKQK